MHDCGVPQDALAGPVGVRGVDVLPLLLKSPGPTFRAGSPGQTMECCADDPIYSHQDLESVSGASLDLHLGFLPRSQDNTYGATDHLAR